MPFWVNTIDPRRHSWVNIVWPRGRFRVRVLRYAAPLLRRRPRMPSICSASMWSLSRARAQVRFLRVWGTFENLPPGHSRLEQRRLPPFQGEASARLAQLGNERHQDAIRLYSATWTQRAADPCRSGGSSRGRHGPRPCPAENGAVHPIHGRRWRPRPLSSIYDRLALHSDH
jgi:hypothetical protein